MGFYTVKERNEQIKNTGTSVSKYVIETADCETEDELIAKKIVEAEKMRVDKLNFINMINKFRLKNLNSLWKNIGTPDEYTKQRMLVEEKIIEEEKNIPEEKLMKRKNRTQGTFKFEKNLNKELFVELDYDREKKMPGENNKLKTEQDIFNFLYNRVNDFYEGKFSYPEKVETLNEIL